MNPGQKMFHDFFMNLVQDGKEAEAEVVLAEGFKKQDEGTFDLVFLQEVSAKYYALIKPECTEQLKKAIEQFASKM